MDTTTNAVIYARFSSHSQQEQSIDGQLRYCREYAAQHGYAIVAEYCDRAMSGTNDNRPEFQRMIRDASGRGFQYILVWKLDRFSRNRYDSAIYKRQLAKHGVRVLSVTENVGAGDETLLLEAILEAMAETYSRQLSQNVKRGMAESARKCQSNGGRGIMGYKVDANKQFVIDPDAAAIVQRIYSMYAAGSSKAEIVETLNAAGLRNNLGKPFTFNGITKTLQNIRYTGVYKYGDIEVPGGMPQIITQELWDACQARQQAKPPRIREKAEYLLLGKVYCGYCGRALIGTSGHGKSGNVWRYYAHRSGTKDCHKKPEKKAWLEWYVTDRACRYVLNPDNTEYIAQRVCAAWQAENGGNADAMQGRIKAIDRELDRIAISYTSAVPAIQAALNVRASDLQTERNQLQAEYGRMQARRPLVLEDVKRYLQQLCVGDPSDPAVQKQVIDTFINCVYVWDDKIVVYFNVSDGGQIEYAKAKEHAAGVRPECTSAHHNAVGTNAYIVFVGGYIGIVCPREL